MESSTEDNFIKMLLSDIANFTEEKYKLWYYKRSFYLELAIKMDNMEIINHLCENVFNPNDPSCCPLRTCMKYKQYKLLIYFLDKYPEYQEKTNFCLEYLHELDMEIVKYFMTKFNFENEDIQLFAKRAATYGRIDIIKYFIEMGIEMTKEIIVQSIASNNLDLINLLLEYTQDYDTILDSAIRLFITPNIRPLIQLGAKPSAYSIYILLLSYKIDDLEYILNLDLVDLSNGDIINVVDNFFLNYGDNISESSNKYYPVNFVYLLYENGFDNKKYHEKIIEILYKKGFDFNKLFWGVVKFVENLAWCDVPYQMEILNSLKNSIICKYFPMCEKKKEKDEIKLSYKKMLKNATYNFINGFYEIIDSLTIDNNLSIDKEYHQDVFLETCIYYGKKENCMYIFDTYNLSNPENKKY